MPKLLIRNGRVIDPASQLDGIADILIKSGLWKMLHEARTDYAMLLGAIFLLVVGAGPWSLDARKPVAKRRSA